MSRWSFAHVAAYDKAFYVFTTMALIVVKLSKHRIIIAIVATIYLP